MTTQRGIDLSPLLGPRGGLRVTGGMEAASSSLSNVPGGGGGGGGAAVDSLAAVAHSQYDLTAEGLADSTAIGTLSDQTVNGRDQTQGTGSAQPSAQTDGSGAKVARLDGAGDFMTAAFTTVAQPLTFVTLVKADTAAGTHGHVGTRTGSELTAYKFSGSFQMFAGTFLTDASLTSDALWHVHVMMFNGASSAYYLDGGTANASGNAGTAGLNGLTFGGSLSGTVKWDGDINFVSLYDGNLVNDDLSLLNSVGQELADRVGITWTDIT